jgi:hypothetical protein
MNKSETLLNDLGRRVVRLCIILVIMFLFKFLISRIKVFDEMEFFDTGLTVLDMVLGAATAVILVFLIKFGFYLHKHYELNDFPKAMVIAKWIIMLITAIIGYNAYYHIAKHFLRRNDIDSYNVTFLCISLLLLVRLGILVFSSIDKLTDLFTGRLKIYLKEPAVDGSSVQEEELKCKGCGKLLEKDAAFCPKCGNKVA